jgi:phosphoribosylaminoimidazole-succinocarboxamide synthase
MLLIHHGKVKSVYQHEGSEVMIEYHDKVTAGNGRHVDFPEGKGSLCCTISAILFQKLEDEGIRTHFKRQIHGHRMICEHVDIVPIEVVVRNVAAGGIVRETRVKEGIKFQYPLVEFYLKDDEKNDPLLTPDRMNLMGYTHILTDLMTEKALKVNDILVDIFNKLDITLVDFKLEFGHEKTAGHLLLADEISPDSMRLWKIGSDERFDKDLFRKGGGDIVPAYREILDRLQQCVTLNNAGGKDSFPLFSGP